jgi:hypothetical protein
MVSDINEFVDVITVFKKNQVYPAILKWKNRVYRIKNVNMVHHSSEGKALIHYFSVSDDLHFFRLAFNTSSLQWMLEQVYSD